MTIDLSCYGDDIPRLVDAVPDFELRSAMDIHTWYRAEWKAIAETIGFSQQIAAALPGARALTDRIAATNAAGLTAFYEWTRAQRAGLSESQVRTQQAVLDNLALRGREHGELWRVTYDPTMLPSGACFSEGGRMHRAFDPDTAAGYFGDGWSGPPPQAESACGWTTPLVLHLGTFPWVYSSRLDATGPGVRWIGAGGLSAAYAPYDPHLSGMRAMASLLTPEVNLLQDARQVAQIFEHFHRHTAPLIARLPQFTGRGEAGRLYVRPSGFLHVHQGSLHVASLMGPRGRIAAPAYNYVLRRFASFFAVRRATLRALPALGPELQRIAATSADPCLRQHLEVARAS